MKDNELWNTTTKLNHPEKIELLPGNSSLLQPIYHSAKFMPSEDYPLWDQFIYTRVSNPTIRQLEVTLADLQKKEDCIVVSSGIAAITTTFLSLLRQGDHIVTFRELYKPSRQFIREKLPLFGIEHTVLSLSSLDELENTLKKNTRLVHFESPANPHLQLADIEKIIEICHRKNVLVSMDGTFGGLHQHTRYAVDIMIQSLTKFANGHGDVTAGAIAASKEITKRIRETSLYLGASLDPQAGYLIQRGLKTYMLRYNKQTETAQEIVSFLRNHPRVKRVHYPEGELADKQMEDKGSILAFEIDPQVAPSADKFCYRLSLIQLTASVGSTESIICPTMTFFGQDLSPSDREALGINAFSLRLSVGLEDSSDLIRDLSSALDQTDSYDE